MERAAVTTIQTACVGKKCLLYYLSLMTPQHARLAHRELTVPRDATSLIQFASHAPQAALLLVSTSLAGAALFQIVFAKVSADMCHK